MDNHLRFAAAKPSRQLVALKGLLSANRELLKILTMLRDQHLPQALVGGGAIYQTVWNQLTDRPLWHGVKDTDVIYFDDVDLSYEAEDDVIRRFEPMFTDAPVPIEIRNQARLHLWFGKKFGYEVPPLRSASEALTRYASRTHAVAVRLDADGQLQIEAPFGLDDLFAFRVTPNMRGKSREAHAAKGMRAKANWPELTIVPWPE